LSAKRPVDRKLSRSLRDLGAGTKRAISGNSKAAKKRDKRGNATEPEGSEGGKAS